MVSLDELLDGAATVARAERLPRFALAEEVSALKRSGDWRRLPYPEGYHSNGVDLSGKHAGTFRRWLSGFAWGARNLRKVDLSEGELEDLVDLHEWAAGLGLDTASMAALGKPVLKGIKATCPSPEEQAEKLRDALAMLQTHGFVEAIKPAYEHKPSYHLEVAEEAGMYRLRALVIEYGGAPYRNLYPKNLVHGMSKRLRCSVTVREETT